jgi:hypothetical protein
LVQGEQPMQTIAVRQKLPFFAMPFDTENDPFTKTGSGRTQGKQHSKKRGLRRFSQVRGYQLLGVGE